MLLPMCLTCDTYDRNGQSNKTNTFVGKRKINNNNNNNIKILYCCMVDEGSIVNCVMESVYCHLSHMFYF